MVADLRKVQENQGFSENRIDKSGFGGEKEWVIVIGAAYLKKTNSFRYTKVNHGLFSFQMNRIISADAFWY